MRISASGKTKAERNYEKGKKTMRKRNRIVRKTASYALSAALAVTMVPAFGISAGAQEQTGAVQ